jgi:diacylglycerol kinase family enzyme
VKHLFIVNPSSSGVKGKVPGVVGKITSFFGDYPSMRYDIHVTRWKRDAVGFVRKYALASDEYVRVYAVGGTSTLFEVINGVIGLPNVQVANYPLGLGNSFLHCFGDRQFHLFLSLRNLVFSGTIPIDVIRCGYNYGIAFGLLGIESYACRDGDLFMEKTGLGVDLCYIGAGMYNYLWLNEIQEYSVNLDGSTLDGEYLTIFIANQPCYGIKMNPGPDARPNDGLLDLYLIKKPPKHKIPQTLYDYIHGFYRKWPEYIDHYTGRRLSISSGDIMCACIDGEIFYDTAIDFEIMPYAVDFVCPPGINVEGPFGVNTSPAGDGE